MTLLAPFPQFPKDTDNMLGELAQWQLSFTFLAALLIRLNVTASEYPGSWDDKVGLLLNPLYSIKLNGTLIVSNYLIHSTTYKLRSVAHSKIPQPRRARCSSGCWLASPSRAPPRP